MIARTKLFSVLGLAVLAGAAMAFAPDKEMKAAKIGETAPTWKLKDLNGKEVSLADFKNKIVVMDWVNPNCPVCKGCHEDARIPNMIKELKGMKDVVFVAVNSTATTTVEENKNALTKYKAEYTVLLDNDGTVGHAYGAKTTPNIFVVDTKGVLRYAGALDNGGPAGKPADGAPLTNYAINAVKQIQAGETVSPDTTKSYGCSVKYGKAADGDKGGKKEHKN